MADISNMIAQFGQDAGSGIAQGFQRGMERRRRNRLLDLNQQAQQRQEQQQMAEAQRQRQEADRKAQYEYMQRGTQVLAQTPPEQRAQVWGGLMQGAQERGWDIAGEEQWDEARLPELMGRFGTASKGADVPASVRDRNALYEIMQDPSAPDWKRKAAEIELGLRERKVGSSKLTIAEDGKTDIVAGSEAAIAGATAEAGEQGKIDAQVSSGDDLAALEDKKARAAGNARDSVERASAAFDQVAEVSKSIGLYDEAINAIDEGANTGRALKFLPSFSEATNKFENAANQLGLSVIGQASFGALSEAELRMALETAVPDGMQPAALREWLMEKRNAQTKLANELRKLGTFLQRGGTVSEWYAMQDQAPQAQAQQPASTSGFKIISVE